ncbi:ATP-binding protein [Belliella sp. R4-6]|uniref:ATP-binding protein n=1 Tax=Belliella alkalica TaxID=1730871 RepID=A0ABS9VHL5_9BACT|nr:ATP-binding protein [Belliella alkalica]MCH7415932.1 ATP-binding protein [Belliella alkalica]
MMLTSLAEGEERKKGEEGRRKGERKENILITGATGSGKSYIASALGNQACMQGVKTQYYNTTKLFPKLKMLKADGSYIREVARIEKQDLLILDDFGIQQLDDMARMALLEIIEDRWIFRTILTPVLDILTPLKMGLVL